MKKILLLFIMGILLFSLVSAANNAVVRNVKPISAANAYTLQNGQALQVQAVSENKIKIKTENVEAATDLEISSEENDGKSTIYAKLSNGNEEETKIMPNTASATAISRLQIKNCIAPECTIQLKEVSNANQKKIAYIIETQKPMKVLGIFKKQMQVEAQIDANNGQVLAIKKPWWAFLAKEETA